MNLLHPIQVVAPKKAPLIQDASSGSVKQEALPNGLVSCFEGGLLSRAPDQRCSEDGIRTYMLGASQQEIPGSG
jgi:hypothetical protein